MIQARVKDQIDLLKKQSDKFQAEFSKRLDVAKVEGQRILKELGVETGTEKKDITEVLAELRAANPTVREFFRNLNVATYDNRFRFNWDATMISAYAKQQAEKTYLKELKPRLQEVRSSLNEQLKEVQAKTQTLRAKFTA